MTNRAKLARAERHINFTDFIWSPFYLDATPKVNRSEVVQRWCRPGSGIRTTLVDRLSDLGPDARLEPRVERPTVDCPYRKFDPAEEG